MESSKGKRIPLGAEKEVGSFEAFHAKKSKDIREAKILVDIRGGKETKKSMDVSVNRVPV